MSAKARQSGGARAAFTLAELLVVIAMVALLTGLLLPALNGTRELTRRAICASNLRQLAIANLGYAAENRGAFVLAAADMLSPSKNKRWHGERDSWNDPFDPARSPLAAYLGDGGVKQCPSFKPDTTGFETGNGGYGYNEKYIGGRYDLPHLSKSSNPRDTRKKACEVAATTAEVAQPGATVMFTDAAYLQATGEAVHTIEYSFCEPPFHVVEPGRPQGGRPNPTIHFRHLDTCNVAWVDGHVDSRSMDFTTAYQTEPIGEDAAGKLGFGWFGADSNELFDLK